VRATRASPYLYLAVFAHEIMRASGHGRPPHALPRKYTYVVDIRLKRAYEPAASSDGYRVLVDRLWPRGVSKKKAKLDEWAKELAPSAALREWFGHEPTRFVEFRLRYIEELRDNRVRLTALRRRAREGTLTLVYAAHDEDHNDAVVLLDVLRHGLPRIR
jgi:uncharacterized protein YeaO (DUF488 family)